MATSQVDVVGRDGWSGAKRYSHSNISKKAIRSESEDREIRRDE